MPTVDRGYHLGDLQHQNTDLQRELAQLKRELELTNQKLGSSMHSIKTFWSPELKKERALRKEESAKYSLINDQLKLLSTENQVSIEFIDINNLFQNKIWTKMGFNKLKLIFFNFIILYFCPNLILN